MKYYIESEYADLFIERYQGKVDVRRLGKSWVWEVKSLSEDKSYGRLDHEAEVFRLTEELVVEVLAKTPKDTREYRKAARMASYARIRGIMRILRSRPALQDRSISW